MDFVLDASAALASLFFDDADGHDATPILARLEGGGAIVPAVFMPEILHVLVKTERRSRGITAILDAQLATIRGMRLICDPETEAHLEIRSLPLARTHRLSIFDATYLELAMRLAVPLATFDNGLIRAAQTECVALLP